MNPYQPVREPTHPEEIRRLQLAEFLSGRHMITMQSALSALAEMKPFEIDRVEAEMRGMKPPHQSDYDPFTLSPQG